MGLLALVGQVAIAVLALVAVGLLFVLPRLDVPGFGGVLRERQWRREEAGWRRRGGPPDVSRSYWNANELRRDSERLAALGYVVVDQHTELTGDFDDQSVVGDRTTYTRLRARRRTGGPRYFVTFARREPEPGPGQPVDTSHHTSTPPDRTGGRSSTDVR